MYNLLHFVSNVYNTVHNLGVTNIPKVAKLNKHQHNVQLGAADTAALSAPSLISVLWMLEI